ncbi:sugar transferase [Janibacter sp. GXQ6167]|uniref:sugar transferase n=1 Tax=Janibacter sp. GXQ6167 TaxID=3240791 RepID=UPI0035256B7B
MALIDHWPSVEQLRQRRRLIFGRSRTLLTTRLALIVTDAVMIGLAALLAALLRSRLAFFDGLDVAYGLESTVRLIGPQIMALWLAALFFSGAQSPRHTGVGTVEYQRVLVATGSAAGLLGVGCFLTQFPLSRGFFLLLFAIGTPALLLGRYILRRVIHLAHTRGWIRTRVLIVGSPTHIDGVARILGRETWLGHEVVGSLVPEGYRLEETHRGVPVYGQVAELVRVVEGGGVDTVIFAEGAFTDARDFRRLAWDLEEHRVQMVVVPALSDVSRQRINVRPVAGLPLVYVERPQREMANRFLKRTFDVVGASLILLLASPVLIVTALAIKIADRGPIVFRQTRTGRDGEPFQCLKFRSMVTNAEELLDDLRERSDGNDVLFKMERDPRITKPGVFIRRFSIDEMPQLFNVLRGEMSLVGPRPPLPDEVAQYDDDTHRRLRVRPGMTGLWQVSGRSELSWEDTVRLDLYYVDNWTFTQDLAILARTVRAVLGGRGAY